MKVIEDASSVLRRSAIPEDLRNLQKRILDRWLNAQRGVTKQVLDSYGKAPCMHWLIKGRRCQTCREIPKYFDHYEYWVDQNKKPLALVGHPYGLCEDWITQLKKDCDMLKLKYNVEANSWYSPGMTVAVIVHAPKRSL